MGEFFHNIAWSEARSVVCEKRRIAPTFHNFGPLQFLIVSSLSKGGTRTFFQYGGTSTIFSTLHGSLWLGKDKGSIMKSAESCGTIYYKHYYGNKLFE